MDQLKILGKPFKSNEEAIYEVLKEHSLEFLFGCKYSIWNNSMKQLGRFLNLPSVINIDENAFRKFANTLQKEMKTSFNATNYFKKDDYINFKINALLPDMVVELFNNKFIFFEFDDEYHFKIDAFGKKESQVAKTILNEFAKKVAVEQCGGIFIPIDTRNKDIGEVAIIIRDSIKKELY